MAVRNYKFRVVMYERCNPAEVIKSVNAYTSEKRAQSVAETLNATAGLVDVYGKATLVSYDVRPNY